MVALLAVGVTTCSLATAKAAIRATKAEVPSPASPQEPPIRADPALANQVVCLDRVLGRLDRERWDGCCPTGGYDRVLYRYDSRQLVVTRRWHTRLFRRP